MKKQTIVAAVAAAAIATYFLRRKRKSVRLKTGTANHNDQRFQNHRTDVFSRAKMYGQTSVI